MFVVDLAGDVTALFDCVYWCGDLNFRLERRKVAVEGMVSHIETQEYPNFETLLGGDQLSKMIVEGNTNNSTTATID